MLEKIIDEKLVDEENEAARNTNLEKKHVGFYIDGMAWHLVKLTLI